MSDINVKKAIIQDLTDIGVEKGDKLFIQSSFKSIGVKGLTPGTFIDAVMEAIGETGLLAMPVFTYSFASATLDDEEKVEPFNKFKTVSSTGIIPQTFLKREGVCRSSHPSHSIAAAGYGAEKLVEGHEPGTPAFDAGTPLHKFAEAGGKILLLGVGHNRSSLIHVAEFLADLPYLNIMFDDSLGSTYKIENDDGDISYFPVENKLAGCSEGFYKADGILRDKNIIRDGRIGNAESMLLKAIDVLNAVVPVLKSDPGLLFCDDPNCKSCRRRKATL